MTTADEVKAALHRRYNKPSQGRPGEQYVCIEEARSGAGFDGNSGQCDFLAINTWQSRGMELIGHEVKVSLSDWRSELAQPEKAEVFARFCRRWYVAVPSDLAAKIRHEVPPAWGLLSVSAKGRVTEQVKAQARGPQPVPAWWWVGWLAQIDRQHKRRLPHLVQQAMGDERERIERQVEERLKLRQSRHAEEVDLLRENIDALKAATGVDLDRLYPSQLNRLAHAWAVVEAAPGLPNLAGTLRSVADALDGTDTERAS